MSLCVSVWFIFTSNSVKLNGKAKWYMYIVQLYNNNKVSVWLSYLFIIFFKCIMFTRLEVEIIIIKFIILFLMTRVKSSATFPKSLQKSRSNEWYTI